ncbi:MAG: prepilin-type N-terminal cleavage/methylation domain-containing protein [Alphaproteobacteria bacterium]|nr:prepilin-type N-terminal cleavage/methylation domain-containing protein [Alphaproteobacteria bacterium]
MKNNLQKIRGDAQGFTLVELAVVMIIIGILIGGILKGQELITNARVTSSISQMESLGAAYNGFRDQYAALPGDIINAVTRVPGCNVLPCANGDGSGVVDTNVGAASAYANEGTQFFVHLLNAGFITGMSGANAAEAFGVSNPAAPIGGGFTAGDARTGTNGFTAADLGATVHLVLTGTMANVAAGQGILTPQQASNLDRRLDDGVPNSGSVVGQTFAADADCTGATADVYGSDNSQVCVVALSL